MDLHFRTADQADLERLIDVHLAAYPDDRGAEARKRNFTANAFGAFENLVVVELDGDIVAHAFLFPFEGWFGGRRVKIGGIASVAVAPEARGRGVGTALMRHLHVLSDVRGDAVTMLYPFRQGWYARFGYATTTSRKRVSFDPSAVPAAWRALARARIRRARGGDQDAVRRAHERAAARASGWLRRPDSLWERLFACERRHVLVVKGDVTEASDDEIAGYVAFTVEQETTWGEQTVVVAEVVADDDETRRVLFGALGAMRDQAAEVVVELDDADPLEHALVDADRRRFGDDAVEHAHGTIVGGPMLRIEDPTRALEARGYGADGTFDVHVRGSRDAADEIALSLHVDRGRGVVSAAQGGGAIRTTRAGLAAMFYGGLRPTDAVRLGLAEGDARTIARADAVTAMPPPAPLDPF